MLLHWILKFLLQSCMCRDFTEVDSGSFWLIDAPVAAPWPFRRKDGRGRTRLALSRTPHDDRTDAFIKLTHELLDLTMLSAGEAGSTTLAGSSTRSSCRPRVQPESGISECAADPLTISFADAFSPSGVIPGRANLGFHLIHDRSRFRLLKQKS